MTFEEILDQAIAMLQRRGRVTYQTLRLQFQVDEEHLEALKDAILFACPQVVDAPGRGLVWGGEAGAIPPPTPASPQSVEPPVTLAPRLGTTTVTPPEPQPPEAERRQLTVLFCDLVDSTVLASQLDPEELREVVRAYQETGAKVIARFEGHIAQYLGDGLLVYFGYPLAHEDDAQRAVRAGLGIVEALGQLNTRLAQERGVHLAVRLGIHTGLVVVGEVGGGTRQEQLALGETPNLAARLQSIAAPNTLVISAATLQLLRGFFTYQSLGTSVLKGLSQPVEVYQVLHESMARSRLEAAGSIGLTPLVGREQEVALLRERWAQVKEGMGQVVLLSGEAGIGKSRLVQVLKEQVATEPQAWLTPCQCSPYHQNTALYPMIDLLERVALRFEREESPQQKLSKLEGFLVQYGLPLAEAVPLFASLLSLPLTADYAPPDLVARAAEAADHASLPDDPPAHRRPATRALCHGRLTLGRSVHAGATQPPGRPRPHRAYPGAGDFSSRLQPALDGALVPYPDDATALAASPGGRDGWSGRAQQDAPGGGHGTGGSQDRRRAAVRGGVDQDGAGVRAAPGARGAL
jgi:class 3 adenylate cyclase